MFDDLEAANRDYARNFSLGQLPSIAMRGLAIVTCMDVRIDPTAVLGLSQGEANVIRNAGGRVTDDVLRSLTLATHLLGVSRIAVMHHSWCALAGRSEEGLQVSLIEAGSVERLPEFLAMPDPDAALMSDVRRVRESPLLAYPLIVEGWRYDVETGIVTTVVAAPED